MAAFTIPFYLGSHYATPQLTMVSMAGYRLDAALTYTGVFVALFAMYYLGYRALAAQPALPAWAVYLPPLLFAAALLAVYPADGWDLWVYISQGRTLAVHHLNPFLVSPQEAPQDPFYAYSSWVSHASIYGPVWVVISSFSALAAGDSIWLNAVLFKLVSAVFLLASVVLVYLILGRVSPQRRHLGAFLLAWNPLVLFEVVGNGHNDMVMVFFALLSLYFLVEGRSLLALPSLGISILTKYSTGLLLPGVILHQLWQRPRPRRGLALLLGGLALLAAAFYLFGRPFQPAYSLSALLGQGESFRSSLATLLFLSLRGNFPPQDATTIAKVAPLSLFAVLYCCLIAWYTRQARVIGLDALLRFGYYSIFFFLVFVPRFLPWYVVWLVGIAALIPGSSLAQRAILFSFSAFLSHIVYYFVWGIYGEQVNYFTIEALGVFVVFAPPLLHWGYSRASLRRKLLAKKEQSIAAQEVEISRPRPIQKNAPRGQRTR
ncbi:MAG TPA: glycosyltransferase family 39 protein [Dehalococcoidia bacterium]|nr:glycosyltransferase family 39 protein [Dehalococcoidia bacterium]